MRDLNIARQRLVVASAMLLAIGMLAAGDAMSAEKLAYRTIEQDGQFELRLIEQHLVAETFVEGDFDRVGSEGFRRLVAYDPLHGLLEPLWLRRPRETPKR